MNGATAGAASAVEVGPSAGAVTGAALAEAAVEQVVLLDDDGTPIGTFDKARVHGLDTPLHLAFSCYGFDTEGRMLLTRRALAKRTWPGVWTNACCGHPQPGEDPSDAVARRVRSELGVEPRDIRPVLPGFRYRAVDASGMVENEVCPVFFAELPTELAPDPDEVMSWAWVEPGEFLTTAEFAPFLLSPWSVLQAADFRREGLLGAV
ncbi:isopentenyl-diphosphate delta-isomerase [Agromyces sp. CF514]|uniref:isopentenyl-diphosphate Delta-isomerase n=1 Tax=Agromyces sp. CF514 TaxID=1881031 RepID=UPI0008F4045B|nr:isopentenyl-diphosphate Delta-isomerase [Agromyces sp. CF514]SFR91285.1 isopentenyl-diphosphate delta-isomerase [Agromyces sp. CF514]